MDMDFTDLDGKVSTDFSKDTFSSSLGSSSGSDVYDIFDVPYARGIGTVHLYPSVSTTLLDKRHLLLIEGFSEVVPLKTVAAVIGWEHYLFVMPPVLDVHTRRRTKGSQRGFRWKHRHSGRLTSDAVFAAFEKVGIPITGVDMAPYVGDEAMVPWAVHGSVSPLVPDYAFGVDLQYGPLKGIFLHSGKELEGKIVEMPLGGKSDISLRVGFHVPYESLCTVLEERFPSHVYRSRLV